MKTIKKIGIAIIIIIIGVAYAYGTWPRPIYNTDIGSLSYEKTDFLTTDSTMEQKFVCGNNGFSGFTIKMLKQDGQNIGNYRWTVEEVKTGKTIGKGTISEADTETRLFEVMACRSFLLSERLSEDSPFVNGLHLVEVMDVKEMISSIQIYLESSELRQKISNGGYECVMENHTYLKRAELLLSLFTSYYKTGQNLSVDPIQLKKAVLESFYLYEKNRLLDSYRQLRYSIRKRFK